MSQEAIQCESAEREVGRKNPFNREPRYLGRTPKEYFDLLFSIHINNTEEKLGRIVSVHSASCRICNKIIKCTDSYGNHKAHLEKKHPKHKVSFPFCVSLHFWQLLIL